MAMKYWNYSGLPPVERYNTVVDRANDLLRILQDIRLSAEGVCGDDAMSDTPNGGSAFPGVVESFVGGVPGMTLRDYFAAQVLASFAGNETAGSMLAHKKPTLAKYCYELADAMLAEREK